MTNGHCPSCGQPLLPAEPLYDLQLAAVFIPRSAGALRAFFVASSRRVPRALPARGIGAPTPPRAPRERGRTGASALHQEDYRLGPGLLTQLTPSTLLVV